MVLAVETSRDPRSDYLELDALYHDYWARALVTGDWTPPPGQIDPEIQRRPFIKAPGYPYVLSIVYRLVGVDYGRARAAQHALGIVSLLLLFLVARRLWGMPAGCIAATLYALSWLFPYYEVQFHETAVVVFLLLLFCWWTLDALARPALWRWGVAGLLVGGLAVLRPNFLLLAPVLAAGLALISTGSRSAQLRTASVVMLGVAVVIAFSAIRNHRVSGERVLVSAGSGLNLYIGNNPIADGHTGRAPDLRSWSSFDHPRLVRQWSEQAGRPLDYSGTSRLLADRAKAYIRAHPSRTAGLWIKKWLLFWGPYEVSVDQIDEAERQHSPWLRAMPIRFPTLLGLAVPGVLLWGLRRRRTEFAVWSTGDKWLLLMLLVALGYAASFIPFTVTGRYRVPIAPLLILPASYLLVDWTGWLVRRDYRRALGWGAVTAAALVMAYVNWTGYRVEIERRHFSFGLAYAKQQRWPEAEREFRAAIDRNPRFVPGWKNYASVLLAQDRLQEAALVLTHARRMDPLDPDLWDDSGTLASRMGKWDEALSLFNQGLAIDGRHLSLLLNAGAACAAQGQLALATQYFTRAVEASPGSGEANLLLGRALAEAGEVERARGYFSRALELETNPGMRSQIQALLKPHEQEGASP